MLFILIRCAEEALFGMRLVKVLEKLIRLFHTGLVVGFACECRVMIGKSTVR